MPANVFLYAKNCWSYKQGKVFSQDRRDVDQSKDAPKKDGVLIISFESYDWTVNCKRPFMLVVIVMTAMAMILVRNVTSIILYDLTISCESQS